MPEDKQEKKIIIDDDWKNQAQAEKEKLAEQAEKPGEGGAAAGAGGERELPPATFSTLISSLVTQIFYSLGGIEDPQTGKRYLDLALAKHHIDMLVVLEEKTKNNLTPEEKKLLDQALYEGRMQYVQIAQRVAQM
jgi:hypothetical protein